MCALQCCILFSLCISLCILLPCFPPFYMPRCLILKTIIFNILLHLCIIFCVWLYDSRLYCVIILMHFLLYFDAHTYLIMMIVLFTPLFSGDGFIFWKSWYVILCCNCVLSFVCDTLYDSMLYWLIILMYFWLYFDAPYCVFDHDCLVHPLFLGVMVIFFENHDM